MPRFHFRAATPADELACGVLVLREIHKLVTGEIDADACGVVVAKAIKDTFSRRGVNPLASITSTGIACVAGLTLAAEAAGTTVPALLDRLEAAKR